MKLIFADHSFGYEVEKLCRIFLPGVSLTQGSAENGEDCVLTQRCQQNGGSLMLADVCIDGKRASAHRFAEECENNEKACERALALALYEALSTLTGYRPPWGILTGVRPAKLMSRTIAEIGEKAALERFTQQLLVREDKARLAYIVSEAESEIVDSCRGNSFSLYVDIPFCPTRCSYCSFVSHSNLSAKKLIPQYVQLLCREIEATGVIAAELGLNLESVYFGGGTPTSLEAAQLAEVMEAVSASFDIKAAREYTVEAGRPDSITQEKLRVMLENGATRISVNPQTFNDGVLEVIGRHHTSSQTLEAYRMACNAGFDNINMDFIAGLPTDTLESFRRSIDIALELSPASITVHTLALKRSSEIVTAHGEVNDADTVCSMLDYVQQTLPAAEYRPYYMYRQSNILGNMENVGWAKKGGESIYNVFMMEECHTVLGAGAAAVTKLCADGGKTIKRVFNFKYPYEYISRFDEILGRKCEIRAFYDNH